MKNCARDELAQNVLIKYFSMIYLHPHNNHESF